MTHFEPSTFDLHQLVQTVQIALIRFLHDLSYEYSHMAMRVFDSTHNLQHALN